jgi:elongation factor Ts
MTNISATMVKTLRESTGAGMMDCKAALTESDGDIEMAVDWLRAKGLSKAARKADRVAAEGLVGVAVDGRRGAVVEVNSETDFVARNGQFQTVVKTVAQVAVETGGDVEALRAAPYPGAGKSVGDFITELVGTVGENMSLRRAARLEVGAGVVSAYVHNAVSDGVGRIGVLVALESTGDAEKLTALGRQLAMHIAAAAPLAVSAEDLEPETLKRERAIFAEQARESGKPDNIVEKMVEGRMRKYYEEVVLLSQTFVIDGETKVAQVLEAAAKDVGAPVTVAAFERFVLGEGIERQESDFAAEVAAAAGG